MGVNAGWVVTITTYTMSFDASLLGLAFNSCFILGDKYRAEAYS